MSSRFHNDAIFWVEVEKIKPNPYQPRRDFNEERLRDLAESIRQYGVLQPLTVTRREQVKEDGGIRVEYELIAGERRHRASQLANLSQVPVIIRSGQENARVKLELAIIENLQREDLNPIERAEAFDQLVQEFEFTHRQVAEKIGKSREYVSNSMRLLKLPEEVKNAIVSGQMTEGHARPIMMLRDKPEHQEMLFKEVVHKGLTVREAESIARRDAQDKVRKKKNKINPETKKLEDQLSDTLGTRVKIEEREVGGKLVIDFFTQKDLLNLIKLMQGDTDVEMTDMMESYLESAGVDTDEIGGGQSETGDASQEIEPNIAATLGGMIAAARARQQGGQNDDFADNDNKQREDDFAGGSEDGNYIDDELDDEVAFESVPEEDHVKESKDSYETEKMSNQNMSHSEDFAESEESEDTTSSSDPVEESEDSHGAGEDKEDHAQESEDLTNDDKKGEEEEIYSVSNFSI